MGKKAPSSLGYQRTSGYYGRYSGKDPEMKFHDVDIDDAVVSAAGTIQNSGSVLGIAQGNGESDRVGRKIIIRKIQWHYSLELFEVTNSANRPASEIVRIILYEDTQCNGAAAAVTDILESDNYQSWRNLANSSRFKIHLDKEITINRESITENSDNTFSAPKSYRTGKFFKNCYIPIEYDNSATDGSLATIKSKNLCVLLLSKEGVSAFDSKMRLRYSDQ